MLLRDGRVLAHGPTEEVLTPDAVRALYDVDAEVERHAARRPPDRGADRHGADAGAQPIRTRLASPSPASARCCSAPLVARAAGRLDRHLAGARVRSVDPVRRQRSTRRSSSSRGCRASRGGAGRRDRWPRPAPCSRRCCAIRWRRPTRSASRAAPRSARCSRSRFTSTSPSAGLPSIPLASFAGSLGALGVVYALATGATPRAVDDGAAARRRDDDGVLLGADRCSSSTSPTSPTRSGRCAG